MIKNFKEIILIKVRYNQEKNDIYDLQKMSEKNDAKNFICFLNKFNIYFSRNILIIFSLDFLIGWGTLWRKKSVVSHYKV